MLLLTNCEKVFGSQFYCVAIIKDQRPKPSLISVLNIFVSSLNAAVGKEIFPVPLSHLK